MPGMPNLPVNLTPDEARQVDGTRDNEPVYQTHRGKLPEGHEDKRPYVGAPEGFARVTEDQ